VKQPIAIYPRVYRACMLTVWNRCGHETLERWEDEVCPYCAAKFGDPGDEDDGRGIPEWRRGLGVPEDTDDPVWESTSDAEKARLHALGYSREIEMKDSAQRTRAERLKMSAFHLRVAIERTHTAFMTADTEVRYTPGATALRVKLDRQRAWLTILEVKIWIESQPIGTRSIRGVNAHRNYAALTREDRS
jgi:hypothetical protein